VLYSRARSQNNQKEKNMDEMDKMMLRLGHLREAIRGNLLQFEYETGLTPRPDALVLDDPDYADIDHMAYRVPPKLVHSEGCKTRPSMFCAACLIESQSLYTEACRRTEKLKEEMTTPAPTPGPRYAVGQWVEILEAGCVTPLSIEGFFDVQFPLVGRIEAFEGFPSSHRALAQIKTSVGVVRVNTCNEGRLRPHAPDYRVLWPNGILPGMPCKETGCYCGADGVPGTPRQPRRDTMEVSELRRRTDLPDGFDVVVSRGIVGVAYAPWNLEPAE
jgi:hypothetical protein